MGLRKDPGVNCPANVGRQRIEGLLLCRPSRRCWLSRAVDGCCQKWTEAVVSGNNIDNIYIQHQYMRGYTG